MKTILVALLSAALLPYGSAFAVSWEAVQPVPEISCPAESHPENGSCVPDYATCEPSPWGIGEKKWSGGAWQACEIRDCLHPYELYGKACFQPKPSVSPEFRLALERFHEALRKLPATEAETVRGILHGRYSPYLSSPAFGKISESRRDEMSLFVETISK